MVLDVRLDILRRNMLVGMMADAVPATDEQHGEFHHVDHGHAVTTGPAWKLQYRIEAAFLFRRPWYP